MRRVGLLGGGVLQYFLEYADPLLHQHHQGVQLSHIFVHLLTELDLIVAHVDTALAQQVDLIDILQILARFHPSLIQRLVVTLKHLGAHERSLCLLPLLLLYFLGEASRGLTHDRAQRGQFGLLYVLAGEHGRSHGHVEGLLALAGLPGQLGQGRAFGYSHFDLNVYKINNRDRHWDAIQTGRQSYYYY